ncbi:uncharacterized protein RAG0_11048 [Rhynchosporium agropyri]|uniref:Chromo domain-containing protein n=1 Tax=Rhynchosporium agropyri TaxID=914238 RepID=A0A1E1L4X8_9HELO|nr:uncharacterized protein RAG0_11048 [Rhynchosporium agropyri]
MLLNRYPGHLVLMEKAEFDFVVAERPEYVPKSGPPLAPISLMLAHDKNGIIVHSFEVNHQIVYVVSWPDAPHLRMTARPETVLDYVSDRTLEEYEYQQTLEREGRGPGSKSGQNTSAARDDDQPQKKKGKPGRKPKHAFVELPDEHGAAESFRPTAVIGPTSRVARPSIEQPEPSFTSPQRPTLASPSKQRGLADMVESEESEEDEELPTDIAIEAQLNSNMESRPRCKLRDNILPSPSPKSSSADKRQLAAFTPTPRDTRSSSRQNRTSFSRSVSLSASNNEAKRQRRSIRDDSIATASSLEAAKMSEDHKRKKSRSNTPAKKTPLKSRHFSQYSSLAKKKREEEQSIASLVQTAAPQSPVEEEEEEEDLGEDVYEVDAILDERQYSVGKKNKQVVTYYLIKWVGNWPLSWEPAENVGSEAIDDYESKKKMGFIVVGEAGAAFDAALEAEAIAEEQDRKDERAKGGRGNDEGDGDQDSFTRSDASKRKRPAQGQVIDDDDSSGNDA